ncbi:MAG: hypothetical protein ACT4PU_11935 [Planctomycetota bacterium]
MFSARRLASLLMIPLAVVALATPLSADVIVVDAAGGGDFTALNAAVAKAQDGDTLLVRPGDYRGFLIGDLVILDRSLTIAADGTGPVLTSAIRVIQNVPGKRVLLRGLTVWGSQLMSFGDGLEVQSGEVWAEDCSFTGADGLVSIGGTPGKPAVRTGGGHLTLLRCTQQGGRGTDSFFPFVPTPTAGGAGLLAFGRVSAYGCTVIGGDGGDFVDFNGGPGHGAQGGAGVLASNATLLLAGSTAIGGDGGNGDLVTGSPTDYMGGDAVRLLEFCTLERLELVLQPGAGGVIEGRGTGAPGDELDAPFSSVSTHPGPYRDYSLGAPTPEGTVLDFHYTGVQGDTLVIFVALSPGPSRCSASRASGIWARHSSAPGFSGR